jgi:hypothetical protein
MLLSGAGSFGADATTLPTAWDNAALQYWQGYSYLANDPQPWHAIMPGELGANDVITRMGHPIEFLRRGARMHSCDWEINFDKGFNATVIHGSAMKDLAAAGLLWARQAIAEKNFEDGLDVMADVLVLARHIAADQTSVSAFVACQIQIDVARQLGTHVSFVPKEHLPAFSKRLQTLPPMPTYEQMLRTYQRMALVSVRQGPTTFPAATQSRLLTRRLQHVPRAGDDPIIATFETATEFAIAELLRIEQLPPQHWTKHRSG